MMNEKFTTFWILYVYILENHFDKDSESFNQFASDANPFIWEEQSWDPVLFEDFSNVFDSETINRNDYLFILKEFLSRLEDVYSDVKNIVESLDSNEFNNQIAKIKNEGFDFYLAKYGIQK